MAVRKRIILPPAQVPSGAVELDPTHPLSNGLQALYTPGATFADLSGKGLAGTPTSAIQVVSARGPALNLPGTGYVSVPDNAAIGAGMLGAFSIVAMFNATSLSSYQWLVAKCNSNTPNPFELRLNNGPNLTIYVGTGAAGSYLTDTYSYTTNTWNVAAVTAPAGFATASFYANGALSLSSATSGSITPTNGAYPMLIGARNDFYAPFNGQIAGIWLYSRQLTAAENALIAARPFSMLRSVVRRTYYAQLNPAYVPVAIQAVITGLILPAFVDQSVTAQAIAAGVFLDETAPVVAGAYTASLADSAVSSDAFVATAVNGSLADSAVSSDTFTGLTAATGSITDSVTSSDSLTGAVAAAATLADTSTSSDTLTATMAAAATLADSAVSSDTVTGLSAGNYAATLADSAVTSDSLTGLFTGSVTASGGPGDGDDDDDRRTKALRRREVLRQRKRLEAIARKTALPPVDQEIAELTLHRAQRPVQTPGLDLFGGRIIAADRAATVWPSPGRLKSTKKTTSWRCYWRPNVNSPCHGRKPRITEIPRRSHPRARSQSDRGAGTARLSEPADRARQYRAGCGRGHVHFRRL